MIFQVGIGVDIRQDEVVLAYLKQSFRGVVLAAHTVHAMAPDKSQKERLADVNSFITEFISENRISARDLVIGIPSDQVIFRELEYPLAVKENLRTTIEYDIDKYIPLSADDIYFDYQVVKEDREKNQLKILLAFIKKTDCKPYLSLCKQWPGGVYGLGISTAAEANCSIFLSGNKSRPLDRQIEELLIKDGKSSNQVAVPQSADLGRVGIPSQDLVAAFGLALEILWDVPIRINLLPPEIRKKPSRVGFYTLTSLAVIVILLGIAWGGGHLFRQQIRLRSVEKEIKQLSSEVASLGQMRQRISDLEKKAAVLKDIRGRSSVLDVLKELTQVIPETAWVTAFSFTEKGMNLNGFAQSASELISCLESSPLFEEVVFLSAIVKDPKQNMERFYIGLKLVNPDQSGKAND